VTYALAVLLGLAAGVVAGLFGVGGGILFVPTLTWLGLTQLHAEATSLLAIIPTVLVGVWRQNQYGNVQWRAAAVIGIASIGAAVGGGTSRLIGASLAARGGRGVASGSSRAPAVAMLTYMAGCSVRVLSAAQPPSNIVASIAAAARMNHPPELTGCCCIPTVAER